MTHSLEPMIQIQKDLSPPDGRDFWVDQQEPGRPPLFSTREVASVFFGKGKLWLQMFFVHGKVTLDGEPIQIPCSEAGYRQFQLHHVELVAQSFLSQGIIDLKTFANCITIVRAIARNYRLL